MRSEILKAKIKNILVIRPDAIGDLVLTLPAIQSLKAHFPEAKITALIREYTRPVADASPAIDNAIYDYDLKKYHFDLSVNFFNEFKDTFAAFKAGIPLRLGDSSRILTAWMNNLRVFRDWTDKNKHEVEQNFELLKPLKIGMSYEKPNFNIPAAAFAKARLLLEQAGMNENDKLAGLHIGSATSQAWAVGNFAKVAAWLAHNSAYKIILIGGEKERGRARDFAALAAFPFVNLVGRIELSELIAVIGRLNFYLGMDTGPTHIAAALNVPQVMLCLNRNAKPYRWGPWLVRHLTVAVQKDELTVPVEKVIKSVKIVVNGGGVLGLAESRAHWLAAS